MTSQTARRPGPGPGPGPARARARAARAAPGGGGRAGGRGRGGRRAGGGGGRAGGRARGFFFFFLCHGARRAGPLGLELRDAQLEVADEPLRALRGPAPRARAARRGSRRLLGLRDQPGVPQLSARSPRGSRCSRRQRCSNYHAHGGVHRHDIDQRTISETGRTCPRPRRSSSSSAFARASRRVVGSSSTSRLAPPATSAASAKAPPLAAEHAHLAIDLLLVNREVLPRSSCATASS